ncbi:hypothetical protein NM208_g3458 [Fusarium decemcellulare]|uniref:Uncharacterized protein n=1 Tax=Fusarium decemcellulare TaxID=57161 RepID=A0ACC1SP49_9HYPO|nr:hypothetical protein NM208_g3458 [Fusarium decemcellulare]
MASILALLFVWLRQFVEILTHLIEGSSNDSDEHAGITTLENREEGRWQPLRIENTTAQPLQGFIGSVVEGAATNEDAGDEEEQLPESGTNVTDDAVQKAAPLLPCSLSTTPPSSVQSVQSLETHQEWRDQVKAKLHILQQTMDPLVASASYNQQYSAIHRLPDEIILLIFDNVTHDVVSFFCLRHVCHLFRRLVHDWKFRHHVFSNHSCHLSCTTYPHNFICPKWKSNATPAGGCHCLRERIRDKKNSDIAQSIIARLQTDSLCSKCQRQYQLRKNNLQSATCKFAPIGILKTKDWLYCSACNLDHPSAVFSATERAKQQRICIGRQGYVRLCDHEVITWADLEAQIARLKEPKGDNQDWETVRICRHPSHHPRCDTQRTRSDRSWPAAKLSFRANTGFFDLNLFWAPHTGPVLTRDGRFFASELRNAVSDIRQSGSKYLMPQNAPSHLPEMACFPSTEGCECLRYDLPNRVATESKCPRDILRQRLYHSPPTRQGMLIVPCIQRPTKNKACLELMYYRTIACEPDMSPSHEWLHALARESYHGDLDGGVPETCDNPTCRYHYPAMYYDYHYEYVAMEARRH